MAAASVAASAAAAETFSIRGFTAMMRAVDAAKCWPFGGAEDGNSETPQLPPMDPTQRSRWWADELAAARTRPGVCAAGGDFAVGGGMGDVLGNAKKRKGSCGSGGPKRAKKRRRALQSSFFLKHKERTSKAQSASCLLQRMLHKGLLRKRKGYTISTLRELIMRKKLQERQDQMPTHRNSLKKQSMRGMDHERSIKISRPTDNPVNPGCEVVKHVACPPKDDIFGDLPLLESSKVMFHTGVDILPTIIEDSFVGDQNGPDAISETEPLKLMPIADISKQTSPPLEDLVKKEQTPDEEATCIFPNDAGRSHSSSAEFDGLLNHTSVTMAKTSLPEMQLKSTHVPALSSYCNEGAKSGSSNCAQGFYTNTNCFQEMERPGTSPVAGRTRTEAIKKEDAAVHDLNNTSVTMEKTSLPETQLKSTHVPALSSYCNDGAKSGPSNHQQGRFYTNTNCFQEMERPGTSSEAMRTRTEAVTEDRDATLHGLNNTSVTMVKTCLPEMQLKPTHVPGSSSYCDDGAKSGSSNHPQDRFYTNTNCFQEMRIPGTSSVAVRTRNEAITEDREAAVHGLNHTSATMAKTCLPEMQLKSTHVPAISSYCNEGAESGSSNRPQGCFYTNTNRFQEMTRPGTSSVAMRTRTEAIEKDRDAAAHGKKSTCISGRLVPTISQRTVNAGINTDGISSCRSRPAQEYVPASSPCKVASNMYHENRKSVDRCTSLSMDDQGSWHSKFYPGRSPASITPFMKIPGLEKISSYDPRTGENNFMNGQSVNTVRCQQQKQVSGMASTMQGQNKIGFWDSQAGKKAPDGFVGRDNCHSHQPTMRLMGKTVSLCKGSMEQGVPTTGKVWIDKNVIEGNRPPCQLPPKRVFPYQDSVIPRTRVHESSDTLPRIHNSTFAEARPIVSDAQNHWPPQANNVSSAVKDCTWNSGSQFGRQKPPPTSPQRSLLVRDNESSSGLPPASSSEENNPSLTTHDGTEEATSKAPPANFTGSCAGGSTDEVDALFEEYLNPPFMEEKDFELPASSDALGSHLLPQSTSAAPPSRDVMRPCTPAGGQAPPGRTEEKLPASSDALGSHLPPLSTSAAPPSDEVMHPSATAGGQAPQGWAEEIEVSMTGSSITAQHRALLGAALQNYRSAEASMREVFKGLYQGLEVAASASRELEELNHKLDRSEKDADLLKNPTDESRSAVAELERLWSELQGARQEAEQQRAAAMQAREELAKAKEDLKIIYARHDNLLEEKNKLASDLAKAKLDCSDAKSQARADREVLNQVREIIADAFSDLPRSAADAIAHYAAGPEQAAEKLFWDQFKAPGNPPLLNIQMKQLVELMRVARPVIEDLCIYLWPAEPLPTSLFGLVNRLQGARPQVDRWKRSACLEGAERAYASAKAHYPKIKSTLEIASGPPEGKDRTYEDYITIVQEGAHKIETLCAKSELRF